MYEAVLDPLEALFKRETHVQRTAEHIASDKTARIRSAYGKGDCTAVRNSAPSDVMVVSE